MFLTVCAAGLLSSSWALTFCSPAVSASICFCCLAMIDSYFASVDFSTAIVVLVTDSDRDRILNNIRDAFRSQGFEIDVIRPDAR
jgi:hypothetical protein